MVGLAGIEPAETYSPAVYKTAALTTELQSCNQDRYNTFLLKLEYVYICCICLKWPPDRNRIASQSL